MDLDPTISEALKHSGLVSAMTDSPDGPAVLLVCALTPEDSTTVAETPLTTTLNFCLLKEATSSVLRLTLELKNEKSPQALIAYIDPTDTKTKELLQTLANQQKYYLGITSREDPTKARIKRVQLHDPDFQKNLDELLTNANKHNKSIPKTKRNFNLARQNAIGN